MRSPEAGQLPCSHRTSAAVKLRGISAASNTQNVARCGQPTSQMALEPNWLQTHTGYEERLTFKHVVPGTTCGPHPQNFKKWFVARLPPKWGPDGLGTLTGGSGMKFRVGLHPPEVGRPQFDNFRTPKLAFW